MPSDPVLTRPPSRAELIAFAEKEAQSEAEAAELFLKTSSAYARCQADAATFRAIAQALQEDRPREPIFTWIEWYLCERQKAGDVKARGLWEQWTDYLDGIKAVPEDAAPGRCCDLPPGHVGQHEMTMKPLPVAVVVGGGGPEPHE